MKRSASPLVRGMYANFKVTMDAYAQAVTDVKRTAHNPVAPQIQGSKVKKDDA